MRSLSTFIAELRTAVEFLTILPLESHRESTFQADRPGLGQSGGWFPWVGAAIGVGAGTAWWMSGFVLPPMLAAVLGVGIWAALTGGLHLDGLADCCDGLLSAAPADRRLEILRDPRLGSFGVIGLCLVLVAKIIAVYSLPPSTTIPAIMLAASTARALILLARWQPIARPGGMGAAFLSGLNQASLPLATIPVIVLCFIQGWNGVLGVLAALMTVLAVFSLAHRRIGGVTGDVLGCVTEIGELVVLLACNLRAPVL